MQNDSVKPATAEPSAERRFAGAHGLTMPSRKHDILYRLRFSGVADYELDPGVCEDAVREIERLRASLACLSNSKLSDSQPEMPTT